MTPLRSRRRLSWGVSSLWKLWQSPSRTKTPRLQQHAQRACLSSSSATSTSSSKTTQPPPHSHSSYKDPVLVWAAANREVAQACLNRPDDDATSKRLLTSSNNNNSNSSQLLESFEDYWEWRGWDFSTAEVGEETRYGQALTTHVLSDPVTLALQFLNRVAAVRGMTKSVRNRHSRTSLQLCCVGARAEASLPVEYWMEMLLLLQYQFDWHNVDVTLDFLGPDVLPRPKVTQTCQGLTGHQSSSSSSSSSLTLRWLFHGTFHAFLERIEETKRRQQYESQHQPRTLHEDTDDDCTCSPTSSASASSTSTLSRPELRRPASSYGWDAFVLFNPGIGHDHLKNDWEPTLELLLSTQQQRCPILLTAHSWTDAQRDARILTDYLLEEAPFYQPNPFASRITHQDPFDASHMVQSNQYFHVIQT